MSEIRITNDYYLEYKCQPQKSSLVAKGIKLMPALGMESEQRDIELARSAIKVLDQEYQTSYSGNSDSLEQMVKYMWRVYGYSFYSAVRAEDERCLALKAFMYQRVAPTESPSAEAFQFETTYTQFAE